MYDLRDSEKEDEEEVDSLRPGDLQSEDHWDGEREDHDVGKKIESSDREDEITISETIHLDGDVPSLVSVIAKTDDGGEGNPIVDCAVNHKPVDNVPEFRL